MSKIEDILAEARALRASLLERLSTVEKSIASFEKLKREVPPDVLQEILGKPRQSEAAPETSVADAADPARPDQVVLLVRDELRSAGRAMNRGQLVKALQGKGVKLPGKDVNKNLGTILWRHPRMFVNIEGQGYWVKGVPLEGIYNPETDDEPLPATTFVKRKS